jgi:hypothetical protein
MPGGGRRYRAPLPQTRRAEARLHLDVVPQLVPCESDPRGGQVARNARGCGSRTAWSVGSVWRQRVMDRLGSHPPGTVVAFGLSSRVCWWRVTSAGRFPGYRRGSR